MSLNILLPLFCLFGHSLAAITGRIVGGASTDISVVPYQVSITKYDFFDEEQKHFCGGTIVSPNMIVTAAHCSDGYEPAIIKTFKIRVGSSSSLTGGKMVNVKQVINHDQFNRGIYDNDISVMILDENLKFGPGVQKIGIASNQRQKSDMALVSGWGYISEDAGHPSPTLNSVLVPIVDNDTCKNIFYKDETITKSMMCAGYADGGKDACSTDSGGPLVAKNELVGVVSWGTGCAQKNHPGIYTNVFYFRDWILDKMNKYSS